MANLLLLKNLLPDLYKVMGTPSRVLVISPFKTPFGFLEAVVEERENSFIVENTELYSQFELLELAEVLKRVKDFSMLPIKIEENSIYTEVPKEGNNKDLINLAKAVDTFLKDLYDFTRNMVQLEEVKKKLGGIDTLVFRFESLKEEEKKKLQERAEQLKYDIIDLYDEIKSLLIAIERDLQGKNYHSAEEKLRNAIHKLGILDHLRDEYKRITGKEFYNFHVEVLRNTLFGLKEQLELS
ncbi:MAG: hypothetical protein DSZ31_06710 [Gammaproteobacteria bacterium]|nr:MAG: hypothetical protein DSZ31_06710 [Gammaproteobacteria bacterium]